MTLSPQTIRINISKERGNILNNKIGEVGDTTNYNNHNIKYNLQKAPYM